MLSEVLTESTKKGKSQFASVTNWAKYQHVSDRVTTVVATRQQQLLQHTNDTPLPPKKPDLTRGFDRSQDAQQHANNSCSNTPTTVVATHPYYKELKEVKEINNLNKEAKYSVNEGVDPFLDQLILESTLETPAPDLSASSEKFFDKPETPVNELGKISHESPPEDAGASKTPESILSGLKPSELQTNAAKSPHGQSDFSPARLEQKTLELELSRAFGKNRHKILSEHGRQKLWFADPQKSLEVIKQCRHMKGLQNFQTACVNMLDDACKDLARHELAKPSSSQVRQRQLEQYEEDQKQPFVDLTTMNERQLEEHIKGQSPAHQKITRAAWQRLQKRDEKERQLEHGAVTRKQDLIKQAERLYS
jgi:hypothetical protein